MITDPIADMLTRLRNGKNQAFASVEVPASRIKTEMLKLMKKEGYIRNFVIRKRRGHNVIKVYLKYTDAGEPSFDYLERVSRPGRRVYVDKNSVPRIAGGNGTAIISTSVGLLTSTEAYTKGVGGEVLCNIW